MKLINKKAAMFGLDARIALAIFGALSVISGAALYSAIKQAQVTAVVTEITELEKAFEAYYLDTGSLPSMTSNVYDFDDLTENAASATGWAGPYSSLSYDSAAKRYNHNTYNTTGLIAEFEYDDWGFGTTGTDISCSTGELCAAFVCIHTIPRSLADGIDLQIDGELDDKKGKVRWYNSETTPSLCYRSISYIK
tara:strand:- start:625 stop:1206 length:582 start_codon:yes stop_codon:yes gene_type:complete